MSGLIINHQLEQIFASSGLMSLNGISGGVLLPSGGTASRPTNISGIIRFNTDSTKLEYADGTTWVSIGTGLLTTIVAGTGLTGGTILASGTLAIGTNAITNALLAQRPANSLMANPSASLANVQDITLGTGLTFSGTSLSLGTSGVVSNVYRNSTVVVDSIGRITSAVEGRIKLLSNFTVFVSPFGNDSNSGGSASPYQTIQRAVNVIASNYDLNGYDVIIQLADGTYTSQTSIASPFVGAVTSPSGFGNGVYINGNNATPANVHIAPPSTSAIVAQGAGALIFVRGVKISTPGVNAAGLLAIEGATILYENITFGTSGGSHIIAQFSSSIYNLDSYSIVGGAIAHAVVGQQGKFIVQSGTVTLVGTPNFSSAFVDASSRSTITSSVAYSGAATGKRYNVTQNAVIDTPTGSTTYFPGNIVGSVTTGGIYT